MTTTNGHMTLAVAVIIACLGPTLVSADVYLSPDCLQGSSNKTDVNGTLLLKVDTQSTCTCLTNGSDPACAQWIGQDGTSRSSCTASATLTYTARKNQTFSCVEMLSGVQGSSVSFTPIAIAGPTSAALAANGQSGPLTFDLCPDGAHVSLVCQTPKVDDYEYPLFSFYATNQVTEIINALNVPDTNATGNIWSSTYLYRPAKAGSYALKCRAVNTVFTDVYKESSQVILTVREPPKVYPVINVNGRDYKDGDKYQVNEDGDIFASCSVTGGSPAVSSVTLTCGGKPLTVTGTKAILEGMRAQRTMAGENCTCSARHVTGCYTLTTSVTLDVAYSPEVINFTINGTEINGTGMVVEKGAYIGFGCYATGNPTPAISITQESPSATPLITVTGHRLNMSVKASCDHTDLFYCVADNGVTAGTLASRQKTLQVYVKCPPQAVAGNPVNYEATVGKDAVIRINVQAYPNPDTFILYTKTDYGILKKKFDAARYTAAYQPQVAPHGTVVITLINVNSEDFVEYWLDITNGVAGGMTYSFTIIEASSPNALSPGEIAGIAVGVTAVVVIAVIIVVACFCTRRGRERGSNNTLAGFDSFGKLGVENHGHYYSSAQIPMPNENPYQKPQIHQVGGYPVPKLPDDEDYVDVQDHYDYIPADSVYSGSTTGKSVAPTEVDYSGTISSTGGKSIYSATTDNTYLPFNSSSGASDATLLNNSKY